MIPKDRGRGGRLCTYIVSCTKTPKSAQKTFSNPSITFVGVSYRTMQTDKELALELADALEDMYYREIIYEAILNTLSGPDWKKHFERELGNQDHRKEIHEYFSPLREQVLNAPDLTSAVREMLEGLERIDPEDSGAQ